MDRQQSIASLPRLLYGIPLSEGRGAGSIWHVHGGIPGRRRRQHIIPESLIKSETGRMRAAVQLVSFVLENSIRQVTRRLGDPYADIFVALREILHDPSLLKAIHEQIETRRLDAGSAITRTIEGFRKRLSDSPGPCFRERANDLLELQGSLLDALAGSDAVLNSAALTLRKKNEQAGVIAVVKILTPRLVLDLNKTQVNGIVSERAGPTSHAAILCRALEIPAVEGIKNILQQLPQGDFAKIDGASGNIWAADRRKTLRPFFKGGKNTGFAGEKGIDLSKITLRANLNFSQNAITALATGAQGIGLYRTEFEFMVANRLLTQKEQFLLYRNVVIAMMGLPVTIRLLDIAVDKSGEMFNSIGGHIDPCCCGALFLLSRPEILETQARAIAETATLGPVRVLYPMVADTAQFLRLRKAFYGAVDAGSSLNVRHGAMIEQPSAVDDAAGILEAADFACLGTNDLTKHLLCVDRETAVAHGAEIVSSPKLWDAIGHVASVASDLGKELTVCGEMASNLRLITRFTDNGIRAFSMDIRKIRRLLKQFRGHASDLSLTQG